MYYMEELCRDLNLSPWKGSICEIGVGVPFQSSYLQYPGASKTVLFTHSPYHKDFQNTGFRSVSVDATNKLALQDFHKSAEILKSQNNLFAIVASGAHKTSTESGQSHGWVTVVYRESEQSPLWTSHFHWSAKKSLEPNSVNHLGQVNKTGEITRINLGEELQLCMAWFLKKVLMQSERAWDDAIKELHTLQALLDNIVSVDIIYDRNITVKQHLHLVTQDTPLIYHNGCFHRSADYIRKYSRCYRGSFNPPTLAHQEIGEGSMFEISLDNARKGRATFADMVHRLKMIDLIGRPILVTTGLPLFVDLHRTLLAYDAKCMEYLVGIDTFNAIVDEKYIDTSNSNFFIDFEKSNLNQSAKFLVLPRDGYQVIQNSYSDKIDWVMLDCQYKNISSTEVRAGNLSYVSELVRHYIEDYNLYH